MSKAEAKDGKIILKEERIRKDMLKGAKATYDAVATTYGPKGKNVIVEKPFGRPVLTRDGVSVAREVYFSDRSKNMGTQMILEASETTNRLAGDGTSGTVVLGYHLLKNGNQAIAAGMHPMDVKEMYMEDSYKILADLKKLSKPVGKGQLEQVASVSSGSVPLGYMIAEAIEKVGVDGGIITEKAPIEEVECEYVDGYYLQTGFQALQTGKKELSDPFVVVSIKRLASASEAIQLLTKVAQVKNVQPGTPPRFLFVGNIEDGAYNCICDNINRGTVDAIILKTPPMFGEMGKHLLEDVAAYAGCAPLRENDNLEIIDTTNVGTVSKVVANKSEATLFADNSTPAVTERIAEIKSQIEAETVDAMLEKLKDRVAKLEGKVALFRIGAATETGKEELEFRVEDAIHATRAAAEHGVVAGGGITLLSLSTNKDLSSYYTSALHEVFKQLLTNANLSAELKLDEALSVCVPGSISNGGFDLKGDGELVDMIDAGILDPTLVIEEIIKNATEAAANMLTIGVGIVIDGKDE